jgi:hypothetical protein
MRVLLFLAISFMSLTPTNPTKQQMPTPAPTPSQSRELNSLNSEKNSLESQKSGLETRQDFWHSAYLILAFVAVALGALSWLFQSFESKNARRERPITARLSEIDGRTREIAKQISEAALGETWEIAANAIDRAEAAKDDAEKAHDSAAQANVRAGDLEVEAAQLKKGNLETETHLSAANAEIERVQTQRIELEKTLLPRTFASVVPSDLDKLKAFTGTKIVLRFLPDAEAERASANLLGLFKAAGWDVSQVVPDPTKFALFFDGVSVGQWTASPEQWKNAGQDGKDRMTELREFTRLSGISIRAAGELVDLMKSHGWEAQTKWADTQLSPDTLEVTVGFKPSPYFDPQSIKEMNSILEKERQRELERERRNDEIEKQLEGNHRLQP